MHKYRVLKAYPKQITNSGRLITLKKGESIYLKQEAQVLRLVDLGFIKPIIEMPKPQPKACKVEKSAHTEDKKMSKTEWLNKKNKGE